MKSKEQLRAFIDSREYPSTGLETLGTRSTGTVSRNMTLYPLSDVNAGSHPATGHYIPYLHRTPYFTQTSIPGLYPLDRPVNSITNTAQKEN